MGFHHIDSHMGEIFIISLYVFERYMLFREILDKFEICLGDEHGKHEHCCLTFDFDRLASDAMQMIVKPV